MPGLEVVTGVILAGGAGTRLKAVVSDRPKVLAPVGGRPFLAYLLDQLARAGIKEVVLCTGYQAEMIEAALGDRYQSLNLKYSREEKPLGTGGALRLALPHCASDPILAMNGDSFIDADLTAFWSWFAPRDRNAGLLLTKVRDTRRYGSVQVREDGLILGFAEKSAAFGPGWINAGVYILRKHVLSLIPLGKPYSLERELFPALAGKNLYGFPVTGKFIDIGTPESYLEAEKFFGKGGG
ncbi:MAG: nucleotidyltransferase family protein [Thermodesulfobacteriota bacterium]